MYRSLPTWLQWAIPFGIAAAVVVALVLYVQHQTNDVSPIAGVTSKSALIEENREDTDIVREQQAPHVATLAPGVASSEALRAAVVSYMHRQVNLHVMPGPVKGSACHAVSGGSTPRLVLHCDVKAASVTYPFYGVVQPSTKQITFCQRVAPAIPTLNIPVSKRCT